MRRVFSRQAYVLIAAATAAFAFLSMIWIPIVPMAFKIITDASLGADGIVIVLNLLKSSLVDIGIGVGTTSGVLSLLIGINCSLLIFYVRMFHASPSKPGVAAGFVGALSAMLGFGCAACGSVFIASLLTSFAGAGALSLLPFGGEEFLYVGMFLLTLSSYLLSRSINKPPVCPI